MLESCKKRGKTIDFLTFDSYHFAYIYIQNLKQLGFVSSLKITTNQSLRGLRTLSKCTMHVTSFPRRFLDPKNLCHEAPRHLFGAPKTAQISLKNRHDTPRPPEDAPRPPQDNAQTPKDHLKTSPRRPSSLQDTSATAPNTPRGIPDNVKLVEIGI